VESIRSAELLSVALATSADVAELPVQLLRACSDALPVTGAGLALMTERGPAGTLAATDGPATELEELQFTLGEGPCVDASTSGRPALHPDLAV